MNPVTQTSDEILSLYRTMLFGDDRFEGLTPISKTVGDTAKVLIRSASFGEHLKALDKEEKFFHVELIETTCNPSAFLQAEIWLAFEWRESNVRHERIKSRSATERAYNLKNEKRLNSIAEKLKSFGFNQPGFAERLSKDILSNWKQGNYSEMLKTLDLISTLNSFDEEDKQ